MKSIKHIEVSDNYHVICTFDNGLVKKIDLSPLLKLPVFAPLQNTHFFKKVKNKGYFIEWEEQEIDLSADTLWHM